MSPTVRFHPVAPAPTGITRNVAFRLGFWGIAAAGGAAAATGASICGCDHASDEACWAC